VTDWRAFLPSDPTFEHWLYRQFRYTDRACTLANGVSPFLPVLLLSLAFFWWAYTQLKRLQQLERRPTGGVPFPGCASLPTDPGQGPARADRPAPSPRRPPADPLEGNTLPDRCRTLQRLLRYGFFVMGLLLGP
jgi:hypothetical protein